MSIINQKKKNHYGNVLYNIFNVQITDTTLSRLLCLFERKISSPPNDDFRF